MEGYQIEQIKTGISGLDEMLKGGIPKGHVFTVMGSFGTGKTTFSLQYLWQGLQDDESCIFISLEEDKKAILDTGRSYGWDFEPYVEENKIALERLAPADAEATISKLKSDLPAFIESFDAERIAIDSVSLLNMMSNTPQEKRDRLFDLCKMVKDSGATTLLTAEVKDDNPGSSRDGLVEYTADGVILLGYNQADSQEVQMNVQVIKMRRINHSRKVKPYEITDHGIDVQTEGAVF
ncbi:MAG: KaiC domain-containing protein [Thermoplasmatota archaeon]